MAGVGINRADVLRVALSILDQGGLPALAMRRIATELGVQQSALYWHFDSKQRILAAIADHILDRVAPAQGDTWQERVGDLALNLRRALLEHKDGAEVVATALAFELGAQAARRGFAEELERAGFDGDDAETAASVLAHFVLGFVTDEQQHEQAAGLGAIAADASASAQSERRRATERFARGVALIIAGAQVRAAAAAESRDAPAPARAPGLS